MNKTIELKTKTTEFETKTIGVKNKTTELETTDPRPALQDQDRDQDCNFQYRDLIPDLVDSPITPRVSRISKLH